MIWTAAFSRRASADTDILRDYPASWCPPVSEVRIDKSPGATSPTSASSEAKFRASSTEMSGFLQ